MIDKTGSIDKIMEAAIVEFAVCGYDGARIDRIANKADINKAMIYYHFKGKEALYCHILTTVAETIYSGIMGLVNENLSPDKNLENLVKGYSQYLTKFPENYLRIMIREIASGGKYFKKITVPRVIQPAMQMITELITRGQKQNLFSETNPVFTMLHVMGAIIFFNLIRITLKGESLHEIIFTDNYDTAYGENLLNILKRGIFRGDVHE